MSRMRAIYKAKGYSDEWIEKRVRGIAVCDELTGEWQQRGVKEGREYAILTTEISRATFGMTPNEYKQFKSLTKPSEHLRDQAGAHATRGFGMSTSGCGAIGVPVPAGLLS